MALGAALCVAAPVAQAETIEALGTGQARVAVAKPLTNAKIVKAVAAARALAVPRSVINARAQAALFARSAHFLLGGIAAIEEGASPYGYFGVPSAGRFGPNRYCGPVTKVKRGPRVDGRPGPIIARRKVTRCFKPETVSVTIAVTFAAAPDPAPVVTP